MSKRIQNTPSGTPSSLTDDDSVAAVAAQVTKWRQWKQELEPYHREIRKWQDMYEFYKREGSETMSDVSMNSAFAIVESMIARLNDTDMTVTAKAHGNNDAAIFERYIGNIVQSSIFDAKVESVVGPFRKIKEIWERDFLVKGNAVAEISYCYVTKPSGNGTMQVVADNPCIRQIPLYSVTFQPWRDLMSSEEYFVEKWVTWDELSRNAKDPVTKKGLYENLDQLLQSLGNDARDGHLSSITGQEQIVDGVPITKKAPLIHLLEHHIGSWLRVYANKTVEIRDVVDPMKIGTHPLIIGMNYCVEGRCFAYGEIAAIYKPIRAQDTIINQRIETVNRYLRPTVLVDPNTGPDLDMMAMLLEDGGVGYGVPDSIKTLETQLPPSVAYTETQELQQGVERAARFSPYASGTPNSGTDTTQGTKGGILALQGAAEPNFQVKMDAVTDMFYKPICRKYLPMIANLMSPNEIKYGALQGEDRAFEGATKNILLGKPTLADLHTIGMLTDAGFAALTSTQLINPQTGQPVINPQTGQPLTRPIPGADKETLMELDWVIEVTLDQRSAHDRATKLQNIQNMVTFLAQYGVHFQPARLEGFFETKMSEIKGLSDVILTPEEQQQMSSQSPREQLRVQVNYADMPVAAQQQALAQAGISVNAQELAEHATTQALMQQQGSLNDHYAKNAAKAMAKAPELPPQPAIANQAQ